MLWPQWLCTAIEWVLRHDPSDTSVSTFTIHRKEPNYIRSRRLMCRNCETASMCYIELVSREQFITLHICRKPCAMKSHYLFLKFLSVYPLDTVLCCVSTFSYPSLSTEIRGKLDKSLCSMWGLRLKLQAACPGAGSLFETSSPHYFCTVPWGDCQHLCSLCSCHEWFPCSLHLGSFSIQSVATESPLRTF